MKSNLRFIFPRLIGATLIVGLASFIMITLFKLLVGLVLIGGVVTVIKRIAGSNNPGLGAGTHGYNSRFGPVSNRNHWAYRTTVNANPVQKLTIVPIN